METVTESTVDGIIASLFFAVLGGAPLAIAYKAINTMDSLFGYKSDTYHDFGWVPARLNDLASWFPARLALPVIAISTALCGLSGIISLAVAIRDGSKTPAPTPGFWRRPWQARWESTLEEQVSIREKSISSHSLAIICGNWNYPTSVKAINSCSSHPYWSW